MEECLNIASSVEVSRGAPSLPSFLCALPRRVIGRGALLNTCGVPCSPECRWRAAALPEDSSGLSFLSLPGCQQSCSLSPFLGQERQLQLRVATRRQAVPRRGT